MQNSSLKTNRANALSRKARTTVRTIALLCLSLASAVALAEDYCATATNVSQAALNAANTRQSTANTNLANGVQGAVNCQSTITGVTARIIPSLAMTSAPSGSVLDTLESSAANQLASAACSALGQAVQSVVPQASGQLGSIVNSASNSVVSGLQTSGQQAILGQNTNLSGVANTAASNLGTSATNAATSAANSATTSTIDQLACKVSGKC